MSREDHSVSIWLENVVPAHEGPYNYYIPRPIGTCSSVEGQKHPVTALHVVSTEVQDGCHSLCPVGGGQWVSKLVGEWVEEEATAQLPRGEAAQALQDQLHRTYVPQSSQKEAG